MLYNFPKADSKKGLGDGDDELEIKPVSGKILMRNLSSDSELI